MPTAKQNPEQIDSDKIDKYLITRDWLILINSNNHIWPISHVGESILNRLIINEVSAIN